MFDVLQLPPDPKFQISKDQRPLELPLNPYAVDLIVEAVVV